MRDQIARNILTRDQRAVDALLPASFGGTVLLARFALHHTRHNSDSFRLDSSTSDSHLPIPNNTGTSQPANAVLQDALQGTNHLDSPWSQVHTLARQPVCFQNTARIPRLHRQSGLSTPPCVRRNANRTNHRTRIQNVLTRGATTFTDGRTSPGLCDYPVLPSAKSRHMPSTGTHDPSLPTHT